jgi:hypothetical protein
MKETVKVINIEKPSEFFNVPYSDLIDVHYNRRNEMVRVSGGLIFGLLKEDFKKLITRLVKIKRLPNRQI